MESHHLNGHLKEKNQTFHFIRSYRVKSLSDSYDSQLHDKVQLLGDDFFLSIQTTELGYPLTRSKCSTLQYFRVSIAPKSH